MNYTTSHFYWSSWDTLRIPTNEVRPSMTLRCPGACDFPPWGHVVIFGTFQFLPTGLHGLCFGICFAGPLPLRSLAHGPLLRVHFRESLVLDYIQKSTISTLAVKLSVSAIIYPGWTATWNIVKWRENNSTSKIIQFLCVFSFCDLSAKQSKNVSLWREFYTIQVTNTKCQICLFSAIFATER